MWLRGRGSRLKIYIWLIIEPIEFIQLPWGLWGCRVHQAFQEFVGLIELTGLIDLAHRAATRIFHVNNSNSTVKSGYAQWFSSTMKG